MDIEVMTLSEIDGAGKSGVVYNKTIALSGEVDSDAVSLPEIGNMSIAIQATTTGSYIVYVTAGTPSQIGDDSCIWEEWDGISAVSPAATAIYVSNASGDTTVCISVRGV